MKTRWANGIRFNLGCVMAAMAIEACGPPPAAVSSPPQSDLESGCHVWLDGGAEQEVYAAVSDDISSLVGASEVNGPTMSATGEIRQNETVVASYADGALAIEQSSMVASSWHADLRSDSETVTLESDGGAAPITMRKSAACSQRDAALGAAAMFLAIQVSARPVRLGNSDRNKTSAPRRSRPPPQPAGSSP